MVNLVSDFFKFSEIKCICVNEPSTFRSIITKYIDSLHMIVGEMLSFHFEISGISKGQI